MKREDRVVSFGLVLLAPALLSLAGIASGKDIRFADIAGEHWIGSGYNRAGLVIDWNDGKDADAWGYRWSVPAAPTGEDLLLDIVSAMSGLYAKIGTSGAYGTPIYGLGYDRDADGFSISDGTAFDTDGIAVTGPINTGPATADDLDDSYGEGWFVGGFWAYYESSGIGWTESFTGASGRNLSDGCWDGWSYAAGGWGTHGEPGLSPAPEPSTIVLIGTGVLALLFCWWRRRRRSA